MLCSGCHVRPLCVSISWRCDDTSRTVAIFAPAMAWVKGKPPDLAPPPCCPQMPLDCPGKLGEWWGGGRVPIPESSVRCDRVSVYRAAGPAPSPTARLPSAIRKAAGRHRGPPLNLGNDSNQSSLLSMCTHQPQCVWCCISRLVLPHLHFTTCWERIRASF